jgi:hypothetical protein
MWRMPTKDEMENNLSTIPPPKPITNFEGTEDEALAAGWRMAPVDWYGYKIPIYLCPECANK